jgi:hypothetical protein
VCNDYFLLSCFKFFNQNKKDNVGEKISTSQLLHLITGGEIPIVHNKKKPKEETCNHNQPKIWLVGVKALKILLDQSL